MTASMIGFGWVAAVGAALFWGTPAFAGAGAGGHLVYSATEGCAVRADFEASVAERGGHFEGDAAPGTGRELRVAITRTASGYLGTFQTLEPDGASAVREVHGATCQDVTAALAVVSAISLRGDDDATSDPGAAEAIANAPAPTPLSTPAPPIAAAPQRPTAPVPDDGRLRASSAVAVSKRIEVPAGTLRFDPARSVSLFAGGELGILPSKVLPRYDLSISGANFVTTPDGKSYLAGVIPRFRVSYFGDGTHDAPYATVHVRGVGFALGLCWSPTYDTRGFVALFCAEYGLGVMQLKTVSYGASYQTPYFGAASVVQTQSQAFQTAGLSFEGEYRLGSFFHLALKLGVDASLQRLDAGEDTNSGGVVSTITPGGDFRSSTLLGYGMLGLGFHF